VKSPSTFALAALASMSCSLGFAAGPPKCADAAKLAWYQRAVAFTDGYAHEPVPEWCWAESPFATQQPARAPRRAAPESSRSPDGVPNTEAAASPDASPRSITIHNDAHTTGD
jgi:hypothetical protein